MTTAAVGAFARFCLDDSSFDANSIPIDINSESIANKKSHIITSGIRGTRSRSKERVRAGLQDVGGAFSVNPSPTELNYLLPKILGANESADTFALAETLQVFNALVVRGPREFTYTGLVVARAVFRGSSGGPLELTCEVLGKTSSDAAAGTVTLPALDTDTMFVFSDGVLTLLSSGREVHDFTLTIDNVVDASRYANSTTRTDVPATDRIITLDCTVPYDSGGTNEDLHDQAIAGAAGTLAFTNGGQSLSFAFANLKFRSEDPVVGGKGELLLPLRGQAFKSGSTNELIVTHDSTA